MADDEALKRKLQELTEKRDRLLAEKAALIEMGRAFKSFGNAIATALAASKLPVKVTKCECCGATRTPDIEKDITDAARRAGLRVGRPLRRKQRS